MDCKYKFSIDRGGSFTDVFCEVSTIPVNSSDPITTKRCVIKLLSEDPNNYKDAPTEGIRRLLQQETGIPHPRY